MQCLPRFPSITLASAALALAGCGSPSSAASDAGRASEAGSDARSDAGPDSASPDVGVPPAHDASVDRPDARIEPVACTGEPPPLPASAPALTAGLWVDISPSDSTILDAADRGIRFGSGSNLTQGMTIDPCNPAVLYLAVCADSASAAYPKGVYRSADAGGSWTRVLAVDSPNHIRVNPRDTRQIYVSDGVAGGTHGFWRTDDGGENWTHLENMCEHAGNPSGCGLSDVYDVAVDPADFEHVLISFHAPVSWNDFEAGAGVMESRDGGDSWTLHFPRLRWGQGHAIRFLYAPELGVGNSDTWLLSIQDGGGQWRTTNAGATWTKVSEVGVVHGGTTAQYAPDGTLYVAASGGVLKSSNNGESFELIESGVHGIGLGSDGVNLYSRSLNGEAPMMMAPIANDRAWSAQSMQALRDGPFEFAFDSNNRILYAASVQAGLLALAL